MNNLTVSVDINKPKGDVWAVITDIKNCTSFISAIISLDIIEEPTDGIIGLKWKETREMFGKEASETMWITEAVDNEYYCTRAESHGSVYLTKMSLSEKDNVTTLTMTFEAQAQSFFVKLLSMLMSRMIKKSMVNALQKDLQDIKDYLEKA